MRRPRMKSAWHVPRLACRELHPELPSAVGHAVLLRGSARKRAGGLDAASYGSWYAALIDLSLRFSGLGWRNVLCDTAFVVRRGEGRRSMATSMPSPCAGPTGTRAWRIS